MWKNSLKTVESDNNKILYETLLDFLLQQNSTYFLNKPRNWVKEPECESDHKPLSNVEITSGAIILSLYMSVRSI